MINSFFGGLVKVLRVKIGMTGGEFELDDAVAIIRYPRKEFFLHIATSFYRKRNKSVPNNQVHPREMNIFEIRIIFDY
jgi:hypothetical protein